MSNNTYNPRSLGALQPYVNNNPITIVSVRAPGTQDKAPIGQIWINTATSTAYILTSITSGNFNWTATGGTGGGTFATVTITGGAGTVLDVQMGNVLITAGDLTVTNGTTSLGGDLNVTGDVAITGDFDVDDAGSITLTSTSNATGAIYLHADGGVAESIELRSDQGTADNSIDIQSDVGGISIKATGSTSGNAIALSAAAGTVNSSSDLFVATATSSSATALTLDANDAAGGIAIFAGTNGTTVECTNGPFDVVTGTGAINIGTDNTAKTITIGSATASQITVVRAGSGTTGLSLSAAGNVQVVPGTASTASPTVSAAINTRVGVATFTGFTTAAAATEIFDITCSKIAATSGVLVTACNLNTSGNNAAMGVVGVSVLAGSMLVYVKNNGGGALGAGDNVLISFWVIS